MKKKIHPRYESSTVSCACGYNFVTKSTKNTIKLEICSNCHPFFTGKQKFLDVDGMVEKFKKRLIKTSDKKIIKKNL
jgi:large subunit ribosomal protein L31